MKIDKTLLVIEDEVAILQFLRSSLKETGWDVLEARTGRIGLDYAASRKPDAILLDLGLPDQDGLQVLKALRKWTSAPVIIISARGQEKDKIAGLDSGADDYLTKPFGVPELMARLRVALRHAEQRAEDPEPVYEHAGLKVDLVGRRVWLKKKEIHLTPIQYDLLAVLVRNAGRVVPQDQLMKEVWGKNVTSHPKRSASLSTSFATRSNLIPFAPGPSKPNPAWAIGWSQKTPNKGAFKMRTLYQI